MSSVIFVSVRRSSEIGAGLRRFLLPGLAILGQVAGHGQFIQDDERVVGVGHFVQAGDADRDARAGLGDLLAQVAVHLADAA